jgi:type IV pilus assembly protein PilE
MLKTAASGFTLIEAVIVTLLVALLLGIALPAWQQQIQRLRRSDAWVALARIELAQSRWRSTHPRFASTLGSAGLALPMTSPEGHYQLELANDLDPAVGYRALARATGLQQQDLRCAWMAIEWSDAELQRRSGPDARLDNTGADNRSCWRQ